MTGFLHDLLEPQAAFMAASLLLLAFGLMRVMNTKNPLEWWHFIATHGSDGHYYADIDKLGLTVGITVSSMVVLVESYYGRLDTLLFGAYLAFVGGVKGYSAYLRSKQGSVVTEKSVEPAIVPAQPVKVTETVTQTPPIKGRK